MLSKAQLEKIEKIIRRRFLAFTYEAFGEQALTREEISSLQSAGLLRSNVRNFIGDSYTLGKVVAMFPRSEAKELGFDEILKRAQKMKPMTKIEEQSIKWAREHAAQYIKGLSDDMVRDVGAAVARTSSSAIRAVQEEVATAIIERKTVSQLKTALFEAIDDKTRDWHRVASTEISSAIQNGIAHEIRNNYGSDALVYKMPNPDACKHCRVAYLTESGVPKIFRLSDLSDSNYGKKVSDWEPTIGPLHPWCQCQLHYVPKGYDFVIDKDGKPVLEFVGKDAKPSVKKSIKSDLIKADGHICGKHCSHDHKKDYIEEDNDEYVFSY